MPRPRNFSTRYYSNKQEKAVAKAIGGKQTANSGATLWSKGDVRTDDNLFLLECKTHTEFKDSFSIKHSWIEKNREEAFQMGKRYSALVVDWGDGENHYLIDERLFLELLEYLRKVNKE
jgi:hypothetical protein